MAASAIRSPCSQSSLLGFPGLSKAKTPRRATGSRSKNSGRACGLVLGTDKEQGPFVNQLLVSGFFGTVVLVCFCF
jgi:hypothetical protein